MSATKIEAKEIKVGDLFSEQFIFEIPIYQRPLSWSKEHFDQLISDIIEAKESGEEQYFLGSIVLWEKKEKKYEVIDGQQRLTALTLLLAIIGDRIADKEWKTFIQELIYQKGNPVKGLPDVMRVVPWIELREIFSKYVYQIGGTKNYLKDFEAGTIKKIDAQDPRYHLFEAMEVFAEKLKNFNEEELKTLARFISNNIYLVYIKASTRSSAFRLFNVLNTRGLPLSVTDILKSINLENITDNALRNEYARKWRELEEALGRGELSNVIAYVRFIKVKEKAKLSMYDEYEKKIFNAGLLKKGEDFFNYVYDIAEIYRDIVLEPSEKKLNIRDKKSKNEYITLVGIMYRYLPFSDWIPPLIAFYHKFKCSKFLLQFLINLEKKIFIEWLAGFTATERITSMSYVLRLIDIVFLFVDIFLIVQYLFNFGGRRGSAGNRAGKA
ncbi:MAG: DUF262 domain-containing protein, partial [Candidatus Njordarchaeia archaeon]